MSLLQQRLMNSSLGLGACSKNFTDQGLSFESKLFTRMCELLEIHKARTTPDRPSAIGQVERYNRLMDAVGYYIDKAHECWDEHFAQITGALYCV